MAGNHNSGPATGANLNRAIAAWGEDLPDWVRMLASACDRSTQRAVADRLGKSGGFVSRLLNRCYGARYDEPEMLVRATFGAETVECPVMGEIPLAGCVRNRRRKGAPRNHLQQIWARSCPTCPLNTDNPEGDA